MAGIREHQAAFQVHADADGGNRVASSDAYEASADYVAARMETAGYEVSSHAFQFLFNADLTPPVFDQLSPTASSYTDGVDFFSMTFSPNGDDTAAVTAVDLALGAATSTSACEAADCAGFPAGTIALIQRGTCTFALKAQKAADAGAVAVVIFNTTVGSPAFSGSLGGPVVHTGGLFTGAEGIKTPAQAAEYGGNAGVQYDPCYHLACDTFAGTSTPYALTGLDQMSDAAAHAVLLFSKRNFDQ